MLELAAHGGLLVCIVINAVQQHFTSTLLARNHPDTFSIDTFFLRPTEDGGATVVIKDIKPGSSLSIVHFALVQDGVERVVGYASNRNLDLERGVSYPIPSPIDPKPPPADLAKLANQSDPNWIGFSAPWHPHSFLKAFTLLQYFFPTKPCTPPNISDAWIRFARADQRFTTEVLGSIADHWRRMIENYVPDSKWNQDIIPKHLAQANADDGRLTPAYSTSYGYPTLSMHLEIKKKLPPQGSEWLFMRARSQTIQNGRFDAEVLIMDEHMDLIGLSHQLAFITKNIQIADTPRQPNNSRL
ncbi:MAG: hypothetical protein LQ350_008241 [Teloschistes chrysophthalmus]|nr:MAG: hypothetical protein LQ350_008241 [Niorma chrysophthalma]